MGNQHYTEKDILDKSRELIHAFMNRQLLPFQDLLDENFVWVGDYASQYIQGRDKFLKTVAVEEALPPVELEQEEYAMLTHERRTWVTYGRFTVAAQGVSGTPLSSRVHFTFVWKQDKDALHLLHANACHVLDEQVQEELPDIGDSAPQARVFDRTNIELLSGGKMEKLRIKDINGNVHFLFPGEILYMKSDDKLTTIYTEQDSFTARVTLGEMEHPHFVRIHNSYLANIRYITKIRRYKATLADGTELPIGQPRYKDIQKRIAGKE
ncbi:LytTR family transcriptional regulator DNA-binding domain-containing protein [Blautia producta]|uniref:LytTR family transcriptional regulator DNA-binding domain-containing protein n=1 Tax=Blautia producta TaxID=33035 RepID=UPI0031B6431B